MSSDIPTQVHRGLPAATSGTSFKRSFEQFGYDSDASLSNDHTEASGSSNPTRNPSGSSTAANERNKRARSTSSSSISDQSTDTSRSTDYDTAESSASLSDASRSDIDVPAGVNAMQALCPTVPILSTTNVSAVSQPLGLPETEPHDEEMLDDPGLPQDVPRELSQNTIASSSDAQDSFRNSIDRFNEFDSEIAALRRSHSNTPSWHSPPPITASPVPGESAHAMASALPWSSTQEAPPWISNTPSPLRNNDEDFFSGLAVSAVTVPRRGDLPSTDVPEEVASSSNPEHPVPLSNDTASSDPDPPLYIPPYPPYPSYRPSHRYGYMVPTPPPRVQGVFPADPPSSSSPTEVFDSPRRESGSSRPRDVEQSTDHEPGRPGWLWTRLQSMRRPPLAPSRRISSPLPGSGSTSSSDIASLGSNSSIRISPTTTSVRRSPTTSERSRRRTSIFRSPESPSSPAPSSPTDESSGPDHVRLFGRRPSGERERSWVPPWMAIHSRSDGVFGEERAGREHVNTDDLESRDSDAGSLPWFSQSQPQAQSQSQPQARAQSRSHRFPWHVAHPDATSPAPLSVPNRNSRVYGTSTAMSAHGPSTTTSAHGPSTSSTSTYNYGTSATRIPSNSLMSESVAEQRRTAARAQLRSHMSSLNHGLGHLFDEADEGAQPSSPTLPPGTSPPPHEIQRGSSSFLFPESEPSEGAGRDAMDTGHSGLPSATQHNLSVEVDWDADLTQLTPAQQYGMMLSRDRDLPDLPRDTEPLRPFTRDTRSSHFPRDTYTRQPGAEPHAYRNINLEPFQSGIFRDSVQRAAEGSHTRVQEGDHTRVHQSAAPVPGWQSRRLRSIIIPDDEDVQMDSDVEMPADIQAPETGWETSDVGRVSDSSSRCVRRSLSGAVL
ncbi:hypothetical protein BV22DRAFT_688398 [Leucogyrophana mollusca]|uniref:Uncharacterized protein n=1 Tax=Leucogyrophana mollusca TaxID=85980 RepID=A0ACB8B868_9AGAM|nr:hypothetical protein BV22DRAFT_688398 [Leucogyrophana mollusca]